MRYLPGQVDVCGPDDVRFDELTEGVIAREDDLLVRVGPRNRRARLARFRGEDAESPTDELLVVLLRDARFGGDDTTRPLLDPPADRRFPCRCERSLAGREAGHVDGVRPHAFEKVERRRYRLLRLSRETDDHV